MSSIEILYAGVLEGHKDAVYALIKGPEDTIVYSAGGDGMVVKWDLEKRGEGELVAQLPSAIYSLLYFKAENILLAGTRFGSLYILDLTTRTQKDIIELKGDVFDLCHIPESGIIAVACAGGYLYFISDVYFKIVEEIHPTENHARTLAYSPVLKHLASGWSDGLIRIYQMPERKEIQAFSAHSPSVFSLVYSKDGKELISGGRDAQIKVWKTGHGSGLSETDRGTEKKIPAHSFTVNDLILIPELNILASASRDKTLKIWDAESYDILKVIDRSKLPAHTHSVNKLLFTSYHNYLLSAGDDKTIKIWGIIC